MQQMNYTERQSKAADHCRPGAGEKKPWEHFELTKTVRGHYQHATCSNDSQTRPCTRALQTHYYAQGPECQRCLRTPGFVRMHLGFKGHDPLLAPFIPFFGKPLIERSRSVQEC